MTVCDRVRVPPAASSSSVAVTVTVWVSDQVVGEKLREAGENVIGGAVPLPAEIETTTVPAGSLASATV